VVKGRGSRLNRQDFLAEIWQAYESGELVPACAWCGSVRLRGEWVTPPPGALATIDEQVTLSHSICPNCAASMPSSRDATSPTTDRESVERDERVDGIC